MKNFLLVHIAFLILPLLGYSQEVSFKLFSMNDGLAGFRTSHVTQDHQGFIWFINNKKLHRYDGHHFLMYPSPPKGLIFGEEQVMGLKLYHDSLLAVDYVEGQHFLLNPQTGT